MLAAGLVLGAAFTLAMKARPHVCDHITAVPYKTGERPLCVHVNHTKETE
jgi:hypothetical protein